MNGAGLLELLWPPDLEQAQVAALQARLYRRLLVAVLAMNADPEPGHPLEGAALQRLQRMVERIQGLLESAHEFLQGEGAVPEGRLQRCALAPILDEAADLFEHRLKAKGLTLQRSFEPGLSVRTRPVVLRESVVANLLSNAMKFSPQGAMLRLSVRAVGDQAIIEVRDQGPGYPPEVLQALKDDGVVVSSEGTQGEAGYGLGLGLVKEYLGRLGGRLELRNSPHGGACASIHLDLAA
jgi:signal transduction histidine kinase